MNKILEYEFWQNTIYDYLIALLILISAAVIIQLFKRIAFSRIKESGGKNERVFDYSFIIKSISKFLIPLLYFGAFYLAVDSLETNQVVSNVFKIIYLVLAVYIVVKFIRQILEFTISHYSERDEKPKDFNRIRPLLGLVNFTLYVIGLLFILDNLGFEIGTIIAGIGIGGIAIALAAQAVLGDLFSYFVIYFDRPFELGDFIMFDDKLGVIEKIGIKSTRIRTLRGELLITSNSNLTNSRLHNFKKMQRRRVAFNIGVIYQTKAEQLEEIPRIIKRFIDEAEGATFDRSHFFRYNDFSLDFETVYYVETNDYNEYMNVQHEIYLKIYKEFEERGIEFAYPTRTLYMNQIKQEGEEKTAE